MTNYVRHYLAAVHSHLRNIIRVWNSLPKSSVSVEHEIKQFESMHPYPDRVGLTSIFRFSQATLPIDYLRKLFVDGKLYHPRPSQFNDPFECRPNFRWPETAEEIKGIRNHLIKVAMRNGKSRKEAEYFIIKSMAKEDFVEDAIYGAVSSALGEIRICSFTSSKDNLLFWAHYADSHRGFCVEYNSSILPISCAFKVDYSNKYPEVTYPVPNDVRGLKPVLIKSSEWAYEGEFRTIFVPEAGQQPANDGTARFLSGNELINVYFGALMEEDHKKLVLRLLELGPFNPGVWQAKLSKRDFELQFVPIENINP